MYTFFFFGVDYVFIITLPDKTLSGQFEHGEVDVALLAPETTPPTLHTQQRLNEGYVCLLSENHPLAGSATLPLDEFCAQNHALVSWPGRNFHGVSDQALAAIGRARRVTLSVCSFLVLPEICASLIW